MGRLTVWAAAIVSLGLVSGCTPSHPPDAALDQGWTTAERDAWYAGDQGSRLMPAKWFSALEQPQAASASPGGQQGLLADPAYLSTFRILPPQAAGQLPIGFAIDRRPDGAFVHTSLHWLNGKAAKDDPVDWVGLNCSACHTGTLTYGGHTLVVQGAPSLFDFQSFIEAVDLALTQTRDSSGPGADGGRWNRFAGKVLGQGDDTPANRALLLAALNKLIAWETQTEALNHTDLRYGYGRVDAVGHIFNRILLFGGAPQPTPNAADAPVSYPHLWNTPLETQVQWDGVAANATIKIGATPTDYGALGRNAGEVLGVFGEAVVRPPSGPADLSGFVSSVDVGSLNAMEVLVTKLKAPPWPAKILGTPGDIGLTDASGAKLTPAAVVAAGGALFQQNCQGCHTSHIPQGGRYETMETFAAMGANVTDEWMACNTWAYQGASGALTGIPVNYVQALGGGSLAAQEPVRALLETTVKSTLIAQKPQIATAVARNIFGVTPLPTVFHAEFAAVRPLSAKQQRLNTCRNNAGNPLMAYKARPLEGVWATAPYLHNGSVPTLYDLLQPPEKRPVTFAVGSPTYDPRKVGYESDPKAGGGAFVFDTRIDGNSNKGHVYGVAGLTETQRLELVEYLKTL
jgi:hypothetical protein